MSVAELRVCLKIKLSVPVLGPLHFHHFGLYFGTYSAAMFLKWLLYALYLAVLQKKQITQVVVYCLLCTNIENCHVACPFLSFFQNGYNIWSFHISACLFIQLVCFHIVLSSKWADTHTTERDAFSFGYA